MLAEIRNCGHLKIFWEERQHDKEEGGCLDSYTTLCMKSQRHL